MNSLYEEYKAKLFDFADKDYDNFNNPILKSQYPTIGIRTPIIKKIAKSVPLKDRDEVLNGFLADNALTYETVLFAGVLAARKGDYEKTSEYLKRAVPLFGSWAHVDCVTPLLRWADANALWNEFRYMLRRDGQYEKRFYIMIMMSCCLDDEHINGILETLRCDIIYGQYYVDMAAAWLTAECLVKYYDKTLPLIEAKVLPVFVHNKAIQKARESYRVSAENKEHLNTLKIKSR